MSVNHKINNKNIKRRTYHVDCIAKITPGRNYTYDIEVPDTHCYIANGFVSHNSLSILANCSSGIEPIFSANYERHITIGVVKENREISEYLRTAHDIEPAWHLKVQARWQKYIDNGISKTINRTTRVKPFIL